MMYRWMRLAGLACLGIFVGASAVTQLAATAQDVPQLSGVWKLNVEASTNPDGPATGPSTGRARGGGGGGAVGGGGDGGSTSLGGPPPGGDLGVEEMQRFMAMRKLFFTAPPMMGVQATATEFKILIDPSKNFGFAHKTDNKKQAVATPSGPADFKVKWDGQKIRREIETKESLKIIEEYSLSPDGKQLIVTLKASSQMVRNVQTGDIKRVYDRQQQ